MFNKIENLKAILFDLDGTLLDINLDSFISNYIKSLALRLSHLIPPKQFVKKLLKTSKIVEENNGNETNEKLFLKTFFPIEGYSYEDLNPIFLDYYKNDFSKLKIHANKKPEARKIIKKAFNEGYIVVIATTPLLPLTAIEQRLEWAGIADFSYDIITSYEFSYATKPNLLYYKQILDTIKQPAEACLMVGDENKDMIASNLGLKTFFIESPHNDLNTSIPNPNFSGSLLDLMKLL